MNLYEINQAILDCVDLETGEIIDIDALEALKMDYDTKIEHIALWIKNLLSDAAQIKAEKEALEKREKSAANKAENLKKYLSGYLNGKKFDTPRVSISFRKSELVDVFDINKIMKMDHVDKYVTYVEPKPNKAAIKEAIKSGVKVPGCSLIEKYNIQIK